MTSYSNLNQKKESQVAIGFLEREERSFVLSCMLNSFMHRGKVDFTFTNTKSQLKRKDDLC